MTIKVTELENARAFRRMNLPLNTPVVKRVLSLEYSKHWLALMTAHDDFMNAVNEFVQGPRAGSMGKWKLIQRKLAALKTAKQRCGPFIAKLGGHELPPVFKNQQNEHEHAMMGYFITEHAEPFILYWDEVIAAAQAGAEVTIDADDIPPWAGAS